MNRLYTIDAGGITEWLAALLKKYRVVAPVCTKQGLFYREISDAGEIGEFISSGARGRPSNTLKEYYFPQKTVIAGGKQADTNGGKRGTVFFMTRPCDLHSIHYFDLFYLSGDSPDPAYSAFREKLQIVALNCGEYCEKGFCDAVGSGPAAAPCNAVILTKTGEKFLAEFPYKGAGRHSGAGGSASTALAGSAIMSFFKPATKDDFHAGAKVQRKNAAMFDSLHKNPENLRVKIAQTSQRIWNETASKCIKCGGCCYVCPTCTCFQMVDGTGEGGIVKYRIWDSCRFEGFTRMAAGFNPRAAMSERITRRIYCKFVYSVKNSGIISCVGCGRCDETCYTDIEIQKTLKRTYENAGNKD
jgi:ferredoxin